MRIRRNPSNYHFHPSQCEQLYEFCSQRNANENQQEKTQFVMQTLNTSKNSDASEQYQYVVIVSI